MEFLNKKGQWKMKHAQTFSILIRANGMQAQSGTIKRILYARVTINGRRSLISVKRQVDESRWDRVAGKVKGRTADVLNLNNYINEVKRELFNIYQQLAVSDEYTSADAIRNKFWGSLNINARYCIDVVYQKSSSVSNGI